MYPSIHGGLKPLYVGDAFASPACCRAGSTLMFGGRVITHTGGSAHVSEL
jgi:hypothetical protein